MVSLYLLRKMAAVILLPCAEPAGVLYFDMPPKKGISLKPLQLQEVVTALLNTPPLLKPKKAARSRHKRRR